MATTRRPACVEHIEPMMFDTTSYLVFPPSVSQELGAQSMMVCMETAGLPTSGVLVSQCNPAQTAGWWIEASGTGTNTHTIYISTSTPGLLFSNTFGGTYGNPMEYGWTHDGVGVLGSSCVSYTRDTRGNKGPLPFIATGVGNSGAGSVVLAPGEGLSIGALNDGTRAYPVGLYYLARWNRVLHHSEMLKAQKLGALAVRDGLVLYLVNGRDLGPYGLVPNWYGGNSGQKKPHAARYSYARAGLMHRVHSPRQFAAPTSDISSNGWTPSTGSDRYATIDEPAPPDFADYDFSPTDPAGQSFRVKIAPAGDPLSSSGHLWRYALRAMGQDTVFTIKVFLGASELDSWTENVSAVDGDVIRFHQLTGAVADAITDYADVRVDISAAAP